MPTAGITHDLTLEDVDGTNKLGFMLDRHSEDARGRRNWRLQDTETIAPRVLTAGALERSEFPPAIQLPIFERQWIRGTGQVRQVERGDDVHGFSLGAALISASDGVLRLASLVTEAALDAVPTEDRPSGFAIVDTELWSFIGRDVYDWNFSTKQFVKGTVPQAVAVAYRNGVPFATRTFAPAWLQSNGAPATLIFKADADANWTLQTGTGTQPIGGKFAAKARNATNADILYLAHIKRADATIGTNILVSSVTPQTASSYSTETKIGESDSPIVNLVIGDDNHVLVFKTNGIYTLETDGTVINRTPNFEQSPRADNFQTAYNWNGRIIASVGPNGLMELRLDAESTRYVRRDISLKWYFPEQAQYDNPVVAISGDDTRLFVLVKDTASYYLLHGELRTIDGQADYRWHHAATITPTTMGTADEEALFIDGLTSGTQVHHRLWIATEDAATGATRLDPQFYPLTADDSDFKRATTGNIISVQLDAGLPLIPKRMEGVDLDLRGTINATHTIKFEYRLDGGAFTNWGTVDTAIASREFPPGIDAKRADIRITFTSNDSNTPELHSWRFRTQLQPDPSQVVPLRLYVADGQRLLNGTRDSNRSAALSQMRTWNASADPVILRRPDFGTERAALFLPGSYREIELHHEARHRSEYIIQMILLLTGANINTGLWDTVTWDLFTWG